MIFMQGYVCAESTRTKLVGRLHQLGGRGRWCDDTEKEKSSESTDKITPEKEKSSESTDKITPEKE